VPSPSSLLFTFRLRSVVTRDHWGCGGVLLFGVCLQVIKNVYNMSQIASGVRPGSMRDVSSSAAATKQRGLAASMSVLFSPALPAKLLIQPLDKQTLAFSELKPMLALSNSRQT